VRRIDDLPSAPTTTGPHITGHPSGSRCSTEPRIPRGEARAAQQRRPDGLAPLFRLQSVPAGLVPQGPSGPEGAPSGPPRRPYGAPEGTKTGARAARRDPAAHSDGETALRPRRAKAPNVRVVEDVIRFGPARA